MKTLHLGAAKLGAEEALDMITLQLSGPPSPKFEDLNSYPYGGGYKCTNEEPERWRELLEKHMPAPKRVAGICSGGEVPLFTFLPLCTEVYAIDHSYKALAVAYIKVILLRTMGPRGIKALFEKDYKAFREACIQAREELPEVLQKEVVFPNKVEDTSPWPSISKDEYRSIKRECQLVPDAVMEAAFNNLHGLTLLHGDISLDLPKHGIFDVLYTSNAFDYTRRDSQKLDYKHVLPLVREGGLLLSTLGNVNRSNVNAWEFVESRNSGRTLGWCYHVYKRTQETQS